MGTDSPAGRWLSETMIARNRTGGGSHVHTRAEHPGRDSSFARMFARFALTGLITVVLIGAVAFMLVRRSATSSAITQAKQLTELAGRGIVEPLLSRAVLRGDAVALARLDTTVRRRILQGTPIVRVKVWDDRGRIVYSDATSLIGRRFALGSDETSVLRVVA